MPSDYLVPFAAALPVIAVVLFTYSAYWGLRVRGVLIDRLYRTRASWIATVALLYAFLVVAIIIVGLFASTNWGLGLFVIEFAVAALSFAWVDTTIQVARRSDPLQRDTLHWSTLRKVLWVVIAITIAGELGSVIYNGISFFSSSRGPQAP